MKKVGKIFLWVFVAMGLAIIGAYFYISQSSTQVAVLNIESGSVLVDRGNGFVEAIDGMKLKLDNSVKTGESGAASIILYESAIVSLDPNTEVTIDSLAKDNIKVSQKSGSTWSKFTGLLGLTGMSIETPETVATVRGTSFGINMSGIIVGEGRVGIFKDGKSDEVGEGEALDWFGENFAKRNLTAEEKARVIVQIKKHMEILKKIRMNEIEKKKFIVTKLLSANNLSYSELGNYLEALDSDDSNLTEISNKIPVRIASAEKVFGLTEKIRKERKIIAMLEGRIETPLNSSD
jgi:predicted transcriptional regulator